MSGAEGREQMGGRIGGKGWESESARGQKRERPRRWPLVSSSLLGSLFHPPGWPPLPTIVNHCRTSMIALITAAEPGVDTIRENPEWTAMNRRRSKQGG